MSKVVYRDIPLHSRAYKNVMKQVELALRENRKVDLDMQQWKFFKTPERKAKGNPLGYYINVSIER